MLGHFENSNGGVILLAPSNADKSVSPQHCGFDNLANHDLVLIAACKWIGGSSRCMQFKNRIYGI